MDIRRLSATKSTSLERNLRDVFHPGMTVGFITYWSDSMNRSSFDTYRIANYLDDSCNIQRIPLVKIVNAILDALRNSDSMPVDDAVLTVTRTLGFNRCGANVRNIVGRALRHCSYNRMIVQSNGRYTLP